MLIKGGANTLLIKGRTTVLSHYNTQMITLRCHTHTPHPSCWAIAGTLPVVVNNAKVIVAL